MGHGIRKFKKVGTGGRMNSDINITPMVDVVLVLLIIFMVVTPLLEKDIEVKVPDTEQTDTPEDVPPDQIVVSVSAAGDISVNMERLSEEAYEEKLKRVLAAKPKGDAPLETAQRQAARQAEAAYNYADAVGIYQSLFNQHPDDLELALSLARNLRFANAAAALKCTRFGGRLGAPTRAEVDAYLRA